MCGHILETTFVAKSLEENFQNDQLIYEIYENFPPQNLLIIRYMESQFSFKIGTLKSKTKPVDVDLIHKPNHRYAHS